MAGRPVTMTSQGDLKKMFDEMAGAMKAAGGTVAMVMHGNEYHLSGDLGVCLMDGEATLTIPKSRQSRESGELVLARRDLPEIAPQRGAAVDLEHRASDERRRR